jgi:hypothetical protein
MTAKDYEVLAKIVANTFAACGEDLRETVYDNLYTPLVEYMKSENPRFDTLRFSYAVATAETV